MTVTAGVSPYYRRVRDGFTGFLRDEARYVGELTTSEVAKLTPVGRIIDATGRDHGASGHAKRSWKPIEPRRKRTGSEITWESGTWSDVDYVPALETGARRHIIPRGGSAAGIVLHFFSKGQERYARSVNHPGMLGVHMMERGLRAAERDYARVADQRYQRFLDGQLR